MADYKGAQYNGGPIRMHKALAMGLNPQTGAEDKRDLVNKVKASTKKPVGKK